MSAGVVWASDGLVFRISDIQILARRTGSPLKLRAYFRHRTEPVNLCFETAEECDRNFKNITEAMTWLT